MWKLPRSADSGWLMLGQESSVQMSANPCNNLEKSMYQILQIHLKPDGEECRSCQGRQTLVGWCWIKSQVVKRLRRLLKNRHQCQGRLNTNYLGTLLWEKTHFRLWLKKSNFSDVFVVCIFCCLIRTDKHISVKIILARLVAKQSHGGNVIVWEWHQCLVKQAFLAGYWLLPTCAFT